MIKKIFLLILALSSIPKTALHAQADSTRVEFKLIMDQADTIEIRSKYIDHTEWQPITDKISLPRFFPAEGVDYVNFPHIEADTLKKIIQQLPQYNSEYGIPQLADSLALVASSTLYPLYNAVESKNDKITEMLFNCFALYQADHFGHFDITTARETGRENEIIQYLEHALTEGDQVRFLGSQYNFQNPATLIDDMKFLDTNITRITGKRPLFGAIKQHMGTDGSSVYTSYDKTTNMTEVSVFQKGTSKDPRTIIFGTVDDIISTITKFTYYMTAVREYCKDEFGRLDKVCEGFQIISGKISKTPYLPKKTVHKYKKQKRRQKIRNFAPNLVHFL